MLLFLYERDVIVVIVVLWPVSLSSLTEKFSLVLKLQELLAVNGCELVVK